MRGRVSSGTKLVVFVTIGGFSITRWAIVVTAPRLRLTPSLPSGPDPVEWPRTERKLCCTSKFG
jgi:hypothetical protein